MPPPIEFLQRRFPSANNIVLQGDAPILVDSGFGSDSAALTALLEASGIPPGTLQMVVNTHYHCDHAGGNHALQTRYDLPVAAHRWEAALVNRRDAEACSARWLGQPIEPYTVTQPLSDGDVLDTGAAQWQVIHTPGHTLGHIALYCDGVLIAGDTIHVDDIAWLNDYREGAGAAYRMLETLDKLSQLPLVMSYSGHGAQTPNPLGRIDAARRRYERWLQTPQKIGWHAVKRIFAYHLMLVGGLDRAGIDAYLLSAPWYDDYTSHVFKTAPEDFIQPLLDEMERSGAATWSDALLVACAPHNQPDAAWLQSVMPPDAWSAAHSG